TRALPCCIHIKTKVEQCSCKLDFALKILVALVASPDYCPRGNIYKTVVD
uniref:Uncharacterized protein n=1 Tax=Aegilops tauschii subsp. strangulata TaxID=200361 RepID=A0A453N9L5_AEGTS